LGGGGGTNSGAAAFNTVHIKNAAKMVFVRFGGKTLI